MLLCIDKKKLAEGTTQRKGDECITKLLKPCGHTVPPLTWMNNISTAAVKCLPNHSHCNMRHRWACRCEAATLLPAPSRSHHNQWPLEHVLPSKYAATPGALSTCPKPVCTNRTNSANARAAAIPHKCRTLCTRPNGSRRSLAVIARCTIMNGLVLPLLLLAAP